MCVVCGMWCGVCAVWCVLCVSVCYMNVCVCTYKAGHMLRHVSMKTITGTNCLPLSVSTLLFRET